MKADIKLKAGDMAITLGYYEKNDGGSANYLIRAKTENDVEDGGIIHFVGNTLVAELIIKDCVTLEMFGAKGDGISNDSTAFYNANVNSSKCILLNKTYNIATFLEFNTNINLQGNKNNKLLVNKIIFNENVIIENVNIDLSNSTSVSPLISNKETILNNIVVDGNNANSFESLFETKNYKTIVKSSKFINNYNGRMGLSSYNSKDFYCINNYFDNIGSSAVELFFAGENCYIQNNICNNCTINSNFTDGVISTYGDYNDGITMKNIVIESNIITNSIEGKNVIRLNGVDNAIVSNNVCNYEVDSNNTSFVFIQDRTDHETKVYNKNIKITNNLFKAKNINSCFYIVSNDSNFNVLISDNKYEADSGAFIFCSTSLEKTVGKINIENNIATTTGYIINANNSENTCDINCINNVFNTNNRALFKTHGKVFILNNYFNSSSNHMLQVSQSTKCLIKNNVLTNTAQVPDIYLSDSATALETPSNTLLQI